MSRHIKTDMIISKSGLTDLDYKPVENQLSEENFIIGEEARDTMLTFKSEQTRDNFWEYTNFI